MGVITSYTCDMCKKPWQRDQVYDFGVSSKARAVIDGHVDVGPCCIGKPIAALLEHLDLAAIVEKLPV